MRKLTMIMALLAVALASQESFGQEPVFQSGSGSYVIGTNGTFTVPCSYVFASAAPTIALAECGNTDTPLAAVASSVGQTNVVFTVYAARTNGVVPLAGLNGDHIRTNTFRVFLARTR
jgi:hypothetical protein